jgi:phage tail sheath protein FI
MATYLTPGVYMEEKSSGAKPIEGVSTSVAAFIGVAKKGPVGKPVFISNFGEFEKRFGGPYKILKGTQEHYLYHAVRHFFTEGGSKCYVVRVMHFTNVDDENPASGLAAFANIAGKHIDDTAASPHALTISAINQGLWGEDLEVQVENSSKYSLLLGEPITAAADITGISLKNNSEVRTGDLLWIVREVTGVVSTVTGSGPYTVTFASNHLTAGSAAFDGDITGDMDVYSPDFKLMTQTPAAMTTVTISGGTYDPTTDSITIEDIEDIDGETLKSGSLLNFVIQEALVVVKKTGEKMLTGDEKVMTVEFDAHNFSSTTFTTANTRVYARGFNILVRDKQSQAVLETHENLSLVETSIKDYIGEDRLTVDSGDSFYIIAERVDNAAVLPDNTPFQALAGGNDGLTGLADADYIGSQLQHTGLYALDTVKDASILAVPGSGLNVAKAAIAYCENRKDLFFIINCLEGNTKADVESYRGNDIGTSQYAAIYYPWIKIKEPPSGKSVAVPPSGAVAGIYADTDIKRGVHKAPAGVENGYVNAASGIEREVTKGENDGLYQQKINVIRKMPEGILVWGARTIAADAEWKYINVRRLFIFLEQSILRGTQWVVFEPNDPSLWKSIKRNITAFLRIQWTEGKLVGNTQEEAFYVKCDAETNPPEVVNAGQVITEIGVAPSKPAEFVVFRIRQYAGGSASA